MLIFFAWDDDLSVPASFHIIGNRTRDLPAYSAVPQPTAPPRAFVSVMIPSGMHLKESYKLLVRTFSARRTSHRFADHCACASYRLLRLPLRRSRALVSSAFPHVSFAYVLGYYLNPLHTKGRPLYLKTQYVPRCKHFSSRL